MKKENSQKRLFSNQMLSKLTSKNRRIPKTTSKYARKITENGVIMGSKQKFSVLTQDNPTRSRKSLNHICLPKVEIKQNKPSDNHENFQWLKKQLSKRLKKIQEPPQLIIQQETKIHSSAIKNVINSESIFDMQLKYSNLINSRNNKQLDILDYRLIHDNGILATKRKQYQQMHFTYQMVKKLS